ncbi:MAG: hypothetical protein ACK5PB_08815 [Pirellula sp.]
MNEKTSNYGPTNPAGKVMLKEQSNLLQRLLDGHEMNGERNRKTGGNR